MKRAASYLTTGVLMLLSLGAWAQTPAPAPAPAPDPAAAAAAAAAAAPAAPAPPPPPRDIRQVQIQAWISETSEKGLRDVGVNLNFTRFIDGVEQSGSVQQVRTNMFDSVTDFERVTLPTPVAPEDQLSQLPSDEASAARSGFNSTLRDSSDEATSIPGIQTRSGFGFTGTIVTDHGTIDNVFRSIERQSDLDLVSKPEVLVVDQGEAMVRAGGKVPYQNATANIYGAMQLDVLWRDVGVNLTLVVGGLSSRIVRRADRRVPVIGALPIIGMPFRSRETDADITHLLVFVSPTIVDLRALNKQSQSALEFWQQRGNEWENADRIKEEINLLETEL